MENQREHLDEQIKKIIQSQGLEKTPEGFQSKVLEQIRKERSRAIQIQPIISKWQWGLIAAFVTGIIFLSFTNGGGNGIEWMKGFNWQALQLSLSSTFIYAFAAFTLFIVLQFFMIKSKLDEIYQ